MNIRPPIIDAGYATVVEWHSHTYLFLDKNVLHKIIAKHACLEDLVMS